MRRKQMKIHEICFCPAWITFEMCKSLEINDLHFLCRHFCRIFADKEKKRRSHATFSVTKSNTMKNTNSLYLYEKVYSGAKIHFFVNGCKYS